MIFDNLTAKNDIALINEKGAKYSYADVIYISSELVSDIQTRSLVFLMCDNSAEIVMAYVGLLRKKIVVVLLDSNINFTHYENLTQAYKPNYTISNKPLKTKASFKLNNNCYIYQNYPAHEHKLHNDLAMLLTTSGSTGSLKYVRLSYENIYQNTKDIITYLEIKPEDITITTLPMNYTYGLSIINTHLFAGASIVLSDVSVMSKRFYETLNKYQVSSFGGVPYTYEMLSRQTFLHKPVKSLKYLTQAGGKLPIELGEKFINFCTANNMKFIIMYGQTEATARMAYLPWDYANKKMGSIGRPIPNGEITLHDENDVLITGFHTSGEIVYQGKNVMMGYACDLSDLEKGNELNGILHTGDIAYRDEEGFYFIVGRQNRFLKLFGKRINLDEIERLLQNKGLHCVCTGKDDYMNIYTLETDNEDVIKLYLYDMAGINMQCIHVHHINEIPRNTSGKIKYHSLDQYNFAEHVKNSR